MKANKRESRIRFTKRQKTRLSIKQTMLLTSSMVAALTVAFVLFMNFSNNEETYGAVSGDYRSKATGTWNNIASWEKFNGTSWVAATITPTSADGDITILSGHTITVTANVTADQLTVDEGGILNI